MIARVLFSAILAGLLAGLTVSLVQMQRVTPLIDIAESFEVASDHGHGADEAASGQDRAAWSPRDGVERIAFTWLANIVTGTGFALLLVAGFVLSRREIDWRSGILWGLAGFAAFSLMPGVVLPPEMPGAAAAPLSLRQALWVGVAASTACGIACFAFGGKPAIKVLGAALVLGPVLIAAPHGDGHGTAPPELAAAFVSASFGAAIVFWLVLGGLAGFLYKRLATA